MLKKLIIIENGEEVQCDSLEEIVKILIDENFYKMSSEEKKEKMRMKAIANTMNNKMEIVEDVFDNNIDGKFIIKNEITYILSLISINKVILLERIDADIFLKNFNKEDFSNNYVILNKFAKDLLKAILLKI